jgi:hypothetical protein
MLPSYLTCLVLLMGVHQVYGMGGAVNASQMLVKVHVLPYCTIIAY